MKKTLRLLLVLILIIPITIFIFFKKSNAPILKGKVDLSIDYKSDLKLDIYEPTHRLYQKNPALIYYHGGAWVGGDKITVNNDRFHDAFNTLRDQGYVIISPEYTLAKFKASPFPECIADAFDVITWIEQNASEYNFDIENIGVLGESAGGHLALMVAYANIEMFTKPNKINLNYAVGVYPPTDLHKLHLDLKEIRSKVKATTAAIPSSIQKYFDINQYLFGFDSEKDTIKANKLALMYSPITYLQKDIPKTLIIHGNKDRVVPISQSTGLKEKMDSMNISLEFHTLDGVDHAFFNATDLQKEQTQDWITDFIFEQYKK